MGIYLSPPIDEIELKEKVLINFPQIIKQDLDPILISKIQNEMSLDAATMGLKLYFEDFPKQKEFLNSLNIFKTPNSNFKPNKKLKFVLLPALFFEKFPDVGADGRHIIRIAKKLGFEIEAAPIKSQGSVSTNAKILNSYLTQQNDKLVLIGMSKGSLDFRFAYENVMDNECKEKIVGFINIAGFVHGSSLLKIESSTLLGKLNLRILGLATGIEQKTLDELIDPCWEKKWNLSTHINVINILPMPLAYHIQPKLKNRYIKLSRLGPNDGMADLLGSLQLPGNTIPLWGADHFCRASCAIEVLHQSLQYFNALPSRELPLGSEVSAFDPS